MTPETILLTDIGGKPEGAVARSGGDASRRTAAAPRGVASPSLESASVLSDTREANTWPPLANGTSSSLPNKNERNSRLKFGWQYIHWIVVIVILLGLLIGVIVTGDLFSKSAQAIDHKDRRGQMINISASQFLPEQAHNVSLEGTMSLSDFTPDNGLISTMTINNVSFSSGSSLNARYVFCFYLSNDQTHLNVTSGYETTSPGSSASLARVTSDSIGQSMNYPFDTYNATIEIVAAYKPFNTTPPPGACGTYLISDKAPDCSLTVQQSLAGWHAKVSLLGDSRPRLQIIVERSGVVIGLALLLFVVAWLLSLAVCFITIFVIWYRNEPRFDLVATCATLLFALPQLRGAQPGIPTTPIVLDDLSTLAIGYLWNIAIVGLRTNIRQRVTVSILKESRYWMVERIYRMFESSQFS
ncbi:hypothetical protein K438DRAFT_1756009 [Mycena galopus ATCC 62051]|nr:hypothetical protein K438DRAFT_1756009 [Mycena galopus ATCC 62051]